MNKYITYICRFLAFDMLLFFFIGLYIKETYQLFAYAGAFTFFCLTILVYIYGAIISSSNVKEKKP